YVAVGDEATIARSTDGTNWTSRSLGTYRLNGICHANGIFVAVGDSALILTSTDGVTWIRREVVGTGGERLNQIAYGNGVFVTVGYYTNYYSSTPILLYSDNALIWKTA